LKLRDFVQKIRQSLIAAGIVENLPQRDDEKSDSSAPTLTGPLLDLYAIVSDRMAAKARFAVLDLEAFSPPASDASLPETSPGLARQWSNAGSASTAAHVPLPPSPALIRQGTSDVGIGRARPSRLWDAISAVSMFLRCDSEIDPHSIDEKEIERLAVQHFKSVINDSSGSPSAAAGGHLDLGLLRQFLFSRRQRLGARREGFSVMRHLLMASSRLSVQNEVLRSLPVALRDACSVPIEAAATSTVPIVGASKANDGNLHYAAFCGGVGWALRSSLAVEFQALWQLLIGDSDSTSVLSAAVRASHSGMISMVLSCIGLKYVRDDHDFLIRVGMLKILSGLTKPSSANSASPHHKMALSCLRLVAFSCFDEEASAGLTAFQGQLIGFFLESLKECAASLGSNNGLVNQTALESSGESSLRLLLVATSDHASVHELLARNQCVELVLDLLAHGSPRIQRLSVRFLRTLLRSQSPRAAEPAGPLNVLLSYMGRLLSSIDAVAALDSAATLAEAAGTFSCRASVQAGAASTSAAAAQSLASELCMLLRFLSQESPEWAAAIASWCRRVVPGLSACLGHASVPHGNQDELFAEVSVALCLLGGHRETLRVGVPVDVYAAAQRKKTRCGILLAYDEISCTATVMFEGSGAVSTGQVKKPEVVPLHSVVTPADEIPFDPKAFSLAHTDLAAFAVLFESPIASDTTTFRRVQMRARALKALACLLESPATLSVFLSHSRLLGASLAALSEAACDLPIAADDVQLLHETESRLALLVQRCAESERRRVDDNESGACLDLAATAQNLCTAPLAVSALLADSGDAALSPAEAAVQAALLPCNPFRALWPAPVRLPYRMVSDNAHLVVDDKTGLISTTGKMRAGADRATAWADCAVSTQLPSFYFEVAVLNQVDDASEISIGFFTAGRGPITGAPGKMAGSFGIDFAGSSFSGSDAARKVNTEHYVRGATIGLLWNRISNKVFVVQNGELYVG
jgi:hypothetical protein